MNEGATAFVVPDSGGTPSGGHTYNARVLDAWRAAGRDVELVTLPGSWPRPDRAARARMAAALQARPTTVVDGLTGACCPTEVAAAVEAGHRVVLLIHLPLADETGVTGEVARDLEGLERWAAHAASAVVATSRTAAEDVRRRHDLAYVAAAPPGVAASPLAAGSGDGPPQLLMLGALTPRKNQTGFVAALATLADRPWTADLVGPRPDPGYAAKVTERIAAAGLTDRIDVSGPLGREALEERWDRADLLVLPSLHETFGLVVTEALARGIPAVVSRDTGAVEALTGLSGPDAAVIDARSVPGALITPFDTGDIAATLAGWLDDPALRAAWRERAAAARAIQRPWSATADDLWAVVRPDTTYERSAQ